MTPNGFLRSMYMFHAKESAGTTSMLLNDSTAVPEPAPVQRNLFSMPDNLKNKTRYLGQEIVNNCCGVNWIAHFPHPVAVNGKYDFSLTINQHLLNDVRQDLIKLVGTDKDIRSNTKLNSVSLVVINHLQKPLYDKLLREFYFEPILEDAYHIGHGHMLTLYARKKYPDQKEKTSVQ